MPIKDNQKPILREYYSIQEELRRVKKLEGELRAQVIEVMLEDVTKAGTFSEELGGGIAVKVTVPKRVEVDKELFTKMEGELNQKGLIGAEGVIQMKPSVSVTAMKYMNDEDKVRYADLFITKTGAPTVKFEMTKD